MIHCIRFNLFVHVLVLSPYNLCGSHSPPTACSCGINVPVSRDTGLWHAWIPSGQAISLIPTHFNILKFESPYILTLFQCKVSPCAACRYLITAYIRRRPMCVWHVTAQFIHSLHVPGISPHASTYPRPSMNFSTTRPTPS